MFIPAGWVGSVYGPVPARTWVFFVFTIVGAICLPKSLFFPDADITRAYLPLFAMCFGYVAALFSLWWAVAFRSRRQWLWRLLSIALLGPLGIATWGYVVASKPSPPGPGCLIWGLGSAFIGLAAWIAPPKIPGEPWCSLTILWRAWRGVPILTIRNVGPENAFPIGDLKSDKSKPADNSG